MHSVINPKTFAALFLLAVLLFVVPATGQDSSALTRQQVAEEAVSILENESLTLENRRELLQHIVNRHPEVADAWAAYGEVLQKAGEETLAMKSFEKAIELDPELYTPWLWIGILAKRGQPEPDLARAEEAFRKAIALGAPKARTLNELGVTLALRGKYKDAIAAWEEAHSNDPEWGVLHNNLIKAALALGDDKLAERFARRAIEAERFEENAVLLYGESLAGRKKTKEAAAFYRLAIDKHPLNPRLRYYYAVSLAEEKGGEEAVDQLVTARRLAIREQSSTDLPQAIDWMLFKLEFPKDEKKFQEARQLVFDQESDPGKLQKKLQKAIEILDPLVQRHSEFWNGYFVRGVAFRRMDEVPKALADLEKVLELHPDEPNATMQLALLWRDQFDFAKAAQLAEKAITLAPRDPTFTINASFIMIDAGNCARAWDFYNMTIKMVGAENPATAFLLEELQVRCKDQKGS